MVRTDFPPAFKHREETAHHIFVLFLGHWFRHHLVHFVHELGAVVNHLFHGAHLQELASLKTVLAIVEIDAAVGVAAAVFIPG